MYIKSTLLLLVTCIGATVMAQYPCYYGISTNPPKTYKYSTHFKEKYIF